MVQSICFHKFFKHSRKITEQVVFVKMDFVKKRFSRKNKASWRKYINIKDVECYLEEKRQEERIGSLSSKKDEDIFVVDNSANKRLLTVKQKRKLNALKPEKSFLSLENMSKVEDPLVQRDQIKLKKNGRDLVHEILALKKSRRVDQSINDRKKYYTELEIAEKGRKRNFFDVWQEEDMERKGFLTNKWISKDLSLYHLKNIGKPLVKVHESAQHKTSLEKAISSPHPGTSYNPSLRDHRDLIQNVLEREIGIIKKNENLDRVTTKMFSRVTKEERDALWTSEMRASLESEDNVPVGNFNENADTSVSVNAPVENKKKSKKFRTNKKIQRILKQKLQKQKEERKKITDIDRVKHIAREVLHQKEKEKELRKKKILMAIKKKYEPKLISKVKYQEPEIEFNVAEDISGNLRNMKTETSLLLDRFNSLQKRNILPPSVDLGSRRRRKVKRYVKSSHKE